MKRGEQKDLLLLGKRNLQVQGRYNLLYQLQVSLYSKSRSRQVNIITAGWSWWSGWGGVIQFLPVELLVLQDIIFLSCVHYTALQKCCSYFVVVKFGSFPLLSGTARKIGSFFSLSH